MAVPRIAVIGGDGIGPEVIDQAIRVADAALRRDGRGRRMEPLPWSGAYYKQTGRIMPADGWDVLRKPRRHPARRHRPARRARPHHAARPAAADAPQVRPVRQPAAGVPLRRRAVAAARQGARLHRHAGLSREHRGRIRPGRRPALPGHAARGRHPDERLHAPRLRAHHAGGLRGARKRPRKKVTSITKSNAQQFGMVLWDEVFEAVNKDYPDVQTQQIAGGRGGDGLRAQAGDVRRGGGQQPVRRHPDRPERDHHRQHGPGGQRQHQSGADAIRACSSRSTARRRTSPARASPIRWRRSCRRGCCWIIWDMRRARARCARRWRRC